MGLGDREFTSEEVAVLCGVTRVTVAEWITRGELSARWTTGGHRRIPRASLAEFMRRHGYAPPRSVATRRALVLLIDDEPEWRERLQHELEQTGDFDVRGFGHAVEALLAVGALRPDVLLVDTWMPGFDVRQLIEAVRRDPTMAETITVALTSCEEEIPSTRRFGADVALPKDRACELLDLLAQVLTVRQRRAPFDARESDPSPPRRRARHASPSPGAAAGDEG